jgi:rhodanese-related sulfurtransferase
MAATAFNKGAFFVGGGGRGGSRARPTLTTTAASGAPSSPSPRRRPAVVSQQPTSSTSTTSSPTLDAVLNFRDLADADPTGALSLAPNRVFRTATLGNASAQDAAAILTDRRVARLLDLRHEDEWDNNGVPGLVEDPFELYTFSSSWFNNPLQRRVFERVLADDAAANRRVRYHTPMLHFSRYAYQTFVRMSPAEKLQAGRGKKPKQRNRGGGGTGRDCVYLLILSRYSLCVRCTSPRLRGINTRRPPRAILNVNVLKARRFVDLPAAVSKVLVQP